MKPYPAYKHSGVDWIDEIPKHWKLKRLKFLLTYQKGKKPEELYPTKGTDNNLPYLSMELLRGINDNISYCKFLDGLITVTNDDILLLWDGANAGEFVLGQDGILSSTMAKLDIIGNNERRFFYFLLKTMERVLKSHTIGMGIPHVNSDIFKDIISPLPTPLEQITIARYLDDKTSKIDTLIEKKQRLIELLKEQRTAIINQAVTKGINPNAKMKDSGIEWLGEIPEHWEVKKLKYLAEMINEKEDVNNKYDTKLALENIESFTGKILKSDEPTNFEGMGNIFHEGDVLFNKLRPYLAKVLITDTDGVCVGDLIVFRSIKEKIFNKFLFYRLLSTDFIAEVNSSTYGSKMPRASIEFIGNLSIQFPSIAEQNEIVHYIEKHLDKTESIIIENEKIIELLKEYRAALISEVVTGKVDVREYEKSKA
jgi:restriction endonuclease S subunit